MLPGGDTSLEDFEWVLREIRACGGDGATFEAQVTGTSRDETLLALFVSAREADYRELAQELRALATAGPRQAGGVPKNAQLLNRIRRQLREIEAIDFFDANGRDTVHALLRNFENAGRPSREDIPMIVTKAATNLHGRT